MKIRRFYHTPKLVLLIIFSCLFIVPQTAGAEFSVAASIKPIHSLVSSIMQGAGQPNLIVSAAGSPHGYYMRPSEMRLLQNADLVIWVGPEFEAFLDKPLSKRLDRRVVLTLLNENDKVKLLSSRQGGVWKTSGEHDHEHGHEHGHKDPHIWLSPGNARAIADLVLAQLLELDSQNSSLYRANHTALVERIDKLEQELAGLIKPLKEKRYIVFHDAYQYFENAFGLAPIGALAVDPDRRPGARRLAQLRSTIEQSSVSCLFSEPQFEPRMVRILTEGTPVRVGVLDPLGADLDAGPELYFRLLQGLADGLVDCLAGPRDRN